MLPESTKFENNIFTPDDQFESLMTKIDGGSWKCLECPYQGLRYNVRMHVESKHMRSNVYHCPMCPKFFAKMNAFRIHKSRYHRDDS